MLATWLVLTISVSLSENESNYLAMIFSCACTLHSLIDNNVVDGKIIDAVHLLYRVLSLQLIPVLCLQLILVYV